MRRASFTYASAWRFFLLAIAPLLVVGLLFGNQGARTQGSLVGWRNSMRALAVKAEVESFLTTPVTALTELTHLADNPEARELLAQSIMSHYPSIESIVLVDRNGTSYFAALAPGAAANASDFIGLDRSRDPLFARAVSGSGPVWSGVFTSITSGKRAVGVGVPSGSGVAIATINIDSLSNAVLKATSRGTDSTVVVTDRQGTVLFHSSPKVAAARPSWRNVEPIAQSARGREGQFEYELDGVPQFGSTALVQGAGWTVLVQQERELARRPVLAVWTGVASATIAAAIMAFLMAAWFARDLSQPIAALADRTARIARGEYAGEATDYRFEEMAALDRSVSQMAQAVAERETDLRSAQNELLTSYEELEAAVAEKEAALTRLSALSAELVATEERERRRLAEELHDRVSQALAVARMRLRLATQELDAEDESLATIDDLLSQAIQQTRAITAELSPPILYELGLGPALSGLVDGLSATYGLTAHTDIQVDDSRLSDEERMALYRIARELIANVVKHAGTSEVWLSVRNDAGRIVLSVRDEGRGFDRQPALDSTHFGLFSIEERLAQLGGSLSIVSERGAGATVTAEIPDGRTPRAGA